MDLGLLKNLSKNYRLFSAASNIKVSVKNGDDKVIPAIIDRDCGQLILLMDVAVVIGNTIVDEVENKYTVVSVTPSIREYGDGEDKTKIKVKEISFVKKQEDKTSLLFVVKQEAVNNSNIQIQAEGNVTINGDVGSINLIQSLDLKTYWRLLKHDLKELCYSNDYKSDIKEIDDYFLEEKKPNVEKIKKSFLKIVIDSLRGFALDYLVRLTLEMGKLQ